MQRGSALFLVFLLSFFDLIACTPPTRKVVIVPHSLCPAGFRETADDYQIKVNKILSGIVTELEEWPNYKFLWSETSYFERWWDNQTEPIRSAMQNLVLQDRFEFASGGFVQQDQAVTTWASSINQMALGHEFIFKTFGKYPRYGWQVDSFGSSSATPLFFSKFNIKAVVVNKVPSSARDEMKKAKTMEFMWSFGGDKDFEGIFTHISQENIPLPALHLLEEEMTEKTLRDVANKLAEHSQEAVKHYPNGDLLIPWGGTFSGTNARLFLGNIEQIIHHLGEDYSRGRINLEFSLGTLKDYFENTLQVEEIFSNSTRRKEYLQYNGDFLPFTETGNEGYAGFYTSRPGLKKLTRQAEASLRSAEEILSLYTADVLKRNQIAPFNYTLNTTKMYEKAIDARKQLAILQGNYAVTGTAPNISVVDDFFNRITNVTIANSNNLIASLAEAYLRYNLSSINEEENVTTTTTQPPSSTQKPVDASKSLQKKNKTISALSPLPNILTTGKTWPLVLYNSLPFTRNEVFRIKVETPHVTVEDYDGNPIVAQVSEKVAITRNHEIIVVLKMKPFTFETIFVTVWTSSGLIPESMVNCTAYLPPTIGFRLHSSGEERMDKLELGNGIYKMSQFSITDEFKMLTYLENVGSKTSTKFMHQMLDSDSPSTTGMFQTAHSNIRRSSPWLWLPIYLIYFASLCGTRLLRKSLCGISFMKQSGLSNWVRLKGKKEEKEYLSLKDTIHNDHEHDSEEETIDEEKENSPVVTDDGYNTPPDTSVEDEILRQQKAYEMAVVEGKPINRIKRWIVMENKTGFGVLLLLGAIFSTVLIIGFKVTLSALGTVMGLILAAIIGSLMGASQRLVPGVAFGIGFGIGMIFALYNLLFDYAVPVDLMVWSYSDGPLMSQATMIYAGFTSVAIRMFKVDGLMGHVFEISYAVSVDVNHQLMTRQSAEMDTKVWWSDNGLEMINRSRSLFDISSRTYYPVVNTAFTREKEEQLTVLTKQTMGITSRTGGVIELMLHRQTNGSDNLGLSQDHLLDASHVEIINWHIYSTVRESESIRHRLSLMLNHPVHVLAGERVSNRTNWISKFHRNRTLSSMADTGNYVELLDLQMKSNKQLVMRWQNLVNTTQIVNIEGMFGESEYLMEKVRPNLERIGSVSERIREFRLAPLETATYLVDLN